MDIRKLQRAIVDGLEDVKGQNIVVFNTEHLSSLFERVIIASGTSNRQTRALAAGVRDAVKAKGFGPPRTEGEENGEWIVVDCGAAVVHVMQPGIREYYHLEEIWGEKPVRMKLGAPAPTAVRKPARAKPARAEPTFDWPAAPRRTGVAPKKKPAPSAAQAPAARPKPAPAAKKRVTRSTGVKQARGAAPAVPARKAPVRRKAG